jgi:hypothetical protein
VRAVAWVIGALVSALAASCALSASIGSNGTGGLGGMTTSTSSSTTSQAASQAPPFDKIDLLLEIDNTRAMGEKQQILGDALSFLLEALTDPPCVDGDGGTVDQPGDPFAACPDGSARRLPPVLDLHVGVITSSLGGHGSDACQGPDTTSCPSGATNTSLDDQGQLITRTDPCSAVTVPTYAADAFLAWDPAQLDMPPGASDLGGFSSDAAALANGAGGLGCAYPAPLESWYRFLVDPDPYAAITLQGGQATQSGFDDALLQQRMDFLRSDSLLAIVMLSDADDCSVMDSGTGYLATQLQDPSGSGAPYHLPRPRAECADDPADPCCLPCDAPAPDCPVDPTCATSPTLDAASDGYGLRCWDQKRRFGEDFLYPTSRYVLGLTSALVPDQDNGMVENPIFSQNDPASDAGVRDASLVVLAGIVGVPWQDVARDPTDIGQGFKTALELAAGGALGWSVIVGDADAGTPPLDPHMIASDAPRAGIDPVTGTALAPPDAGSGADPISGHEFTQSPPDDLEYACIFPLRETLDCSDGGVPACDCADPQNDDPLCEPDPQNGGQRTLQLRGKAYPSLRQLQVLQALGAQAVVTSICPATVADATSPTYGYRPAMEALVEWIARRSAQP